MAKLEKLIEEREQQLAEKSKLIEEKDSELEAKQVSLKELEEKFQSLKMKEPTDESKAGPSQDNDVIMIQNT